MGLQVNIVGFTNCCALWSYLSNTLLFHCSLVGQVQREMVEDPGQDEAQLTNARTK